MKISTVFSLIATTLLSFILTGCSLTSISQTLQLDTYEDDEKNYEERFNEIITALENKDSIAIKQMFSSNAKEEAINLDEGIERIVNMFEGKVISFDGNKSSETNLDGADTLLTTRCGYIIETDKEKYQLIFIEKQNTADSEDNGLYMVELKKVKNIHYFNGDKAGAFTSEMLKPENYMQTISKSLANNNSQLIRDLFAKKVKDQIDIYDISNMAIDFFDGHVQSANEIETSIQKEGENVITKGYYEITTEEFISRKVIDTYLLYFVHKRNEVDQDSDGLYILQIARKTDENTELIIEENPGIYLQNLE